MQISDHAKYFWEWSLAQPLLHTDGLKQETNSILHAPASLQSLVQRLVSFKIYAPSVVAFVGSVSEPDKETITAENLALQKLSTGPFHALPTSMLRQKKICGLKIEADGVHVTSKAARFRVASWDESIFALRRLILVLPAG